MSSTQGARMCPNVRCARMGWLPSSMRITVVWTVEDSTGFGDFE